VIKQTAFLNVLLLLFATGSFAQGKKLKVYISADMEGVGGVSTWDVQASAKGREYDQFRHLMTHEVNAAIAGAFDAGATEVLVSDSHGDAQNIDLELLDSRASLIRAWPRPLGMMQGVDSTFEAVVFIGYHEREGRADAVLAHTFSGGESVKLNGLEMSEAGFNAAIAGDFDVPVVFLSGDQTICKHARELLGPMETAAVKQAIGFHSARMIPPGQVQTLIRERVKRGVERRKDLKPFHVAHPVRIEVQFNEIVKAEVASYIPGVSRISGNTIAFTTPDMATASQFLEAIESLKP
jgi:D-amino peptidase